MTSPSDYAYSETDAARANGFASHYEEFGSSYARPSMPNQHGGQTMFDARGPYGRRDQGKSRNDLHLPDGEECRDWLSEYHENIPVGQIAKAAGSTKRAAENIKSGDNGMQMAHLVAYCRNDPVFRAEFFKFCGGHMETDPEFVAGITMALNSLARRQKP